MGNVIFDPESHSYYHDGIEFPSVTTVINSAGLIPEYVKDPVKANNGTLVHQVCSDWIKSRKVPEAPYMAEFLTQFILFSKLYNLNFQESELRIHDHQYQYAGTLDILAVSNGLRYLIDIKTGGALKCHSVQLAAYNHIVKADKCACLYLRSDGYVFSEITKTQERTGFSVFQSALNIHNFKK